MLRLIRRSSDELGKVDQELEKINPFVAIINALETTPCRYVLVGGFAVVMYGNNRFTPDLNVVLDFDSSGVRVALDNFLKLQMESSSTSDPYLFLDPKHRAASSSWENPRFFSIRNLSWPFFSLELFQEHPLDFEALYRDSQIIKFDNFNGRICSYEHLLQMKKRAGRPQDLLDLANLEAIELIRHYQHNPDFKPEELTNLPKDIDTNRIYDLLGFMKLSPSEKLTWLAGMIDALGGFAAF